MICDKSLIKAIDTLFVPHKFMVAHPSYVLSYVIRKCLRPVHLQLGVRYASWLVLIPNGVKKSRLCNISFVGI